VSYQVPLTDADLSIVTSFADQIVARGLMGSSSVEIETIRRLVRDYRTHQRNTEGRLSYMRETGIGYFTDEILASAKLIAEAIVGDALCAELHEQRRKTLLDRSLARQGGLRLMASNGQGHWLARVILGDRAALDLVAAALKENPR
jgi:hypothetical protein